MTHYQLTKTLRFGLTKVRKEKKHLSHEALDELVMVSEYRLIKKNVLELTEKQGKDKSKSEDELNLLIQEFDNKFAEIIKIENLEERSRVYYEFLKTITKQFSAYTQDFEEQELIKSIRECSNNIKEYLLSWGKVCQRVDKITVRKEFFKLLARKTFFKYESKIGKNKTPLPAEVKLSGQRGDNFYGEHINESISQYWQSIVFKALKLHSQFEEELQKYEIALASAPQNKPHLVDFRKLFLAVCGLVMDSLRPIVNELIVVSDNVSDKDEYILDFVNNKSNQYKLFEKIEILQKNIRNNGGNVYFGRATFNKYTAEQVPNRREENIDMIVDELKLKEFVLEYIGSSQEEICTKLKNIYISTQNSLECLNNKQISPVVRAQFFKYKPIPTLVRFALAGYLSQQTGRSSKEIMLLFNFFGISNSPASDYSKLPDKTNFSLDKYPIKVAFDFAWEQCARSKYANKPVDFPKEICENFLETYFKYDSNDYNRKAFEIYAHLLKINECLATLEHFENEPPKDAEFIYNEVIAHLNSLIELCGKDKQNKINPMHLTSIANWYVQYNELYTKGDHSELKKWISSNNDIVRKFTQAKMCLGQIRGSQKTWVLKTCGRTADNYIFQTSDITEVFKDIASDFGRKFASIRDYFNEENEINKINYGAVIIEDTHKDKYLLLQNKSEGGNDMSIFTSTCEKGDYLVHQVKSLTYKSVNKIYNSSKYPEFFMQNGVKTINTVTQKKFNNDQAKAIFYKKKLESLKQCLTVSDFMTNSKENYLTRFDWIKEIDKCTDTSKNDTTASPDVQIKFYQNCFEMLAKLVDQKGYYLKHTKICKGLIEDLVLNHDCLLLPIVNQNITAANRNNKNQFTKDWNRIFDEEDKDCRLHPEFTMYYRFPTPDYPCPGEKRYSRFQMNCNFLMEVIPSEGEYISRKEQIEVFNHPKKIDKQGKVIENSQEYQVDLFNKKINVKKPSYIIGIDRGINELATLCVIDSNGKIVGIDAHGAIKEEFDIYVKRFDKEKKRWIHNIKPKTNDNEPRAILDLSNLRVETTIEGQQVLVDLSLSYNENGEPLDKQQIINLKHLYYLRCLTYLLQSPKYKSIVLEKLKNCDENEIDNLFKNEKIIDSYKSGVQFTDLPYDKIKDLISKYHEIDNSNKTDLEKATEIKNLCQLDAAESLKKGVVANMIGVVVYILKKLNYDAYISLENLCRAYGFSKDALSGYTIESTNVNPDIDFKDQENAKLAGLGTYSFFEIQLLKKLFKLQIDADKKLLVPAFRSVENYEKTIKRLYRKKENKKPAMYPFGIVCFVSPMNTSHKCPICGASGKSNVRRHKNNDELECKKCGYYSIVDKIENHSLYDNGHFVNDDIEKFYNDSNLKMIASGDDNAAYQIAVKALKNYNNEFFNKIQARQRLLNKELEKDEIEPDVPEEDVDNPQVDKKPTNYQNPKNNKRQNNFGKYNNRNRK